MLGKVPVDRGLFHEVLEDVHLGLADHLHQRLHGHQHVLRRVVVGTVSHPSQQLIHLSEERRISR